MCLYLRANDGIKQYLVDEQGMRLEIDDIYQRYSKVKRAVDPKTFDYMLRWEDQNGDMQLYYCQLGKCD